jgi:hypothetical protein
MASSLAAKALTDMPMTAMSGSLVSILAVASIPFMSGILISHDDRRGFEPLREFHGFQPFEASPITSSAAPRTTLSFF